MTAERLLWAAGGYLAGTFPSTLLVARARHASDLIRESRRGAGEGDPHILMAHRLGVGWAALAAALDVTKGFAFALAARHWGGVPDRWLALVGVTVVIGHSYPFYGREMAGRGLAAAAGVLLALLPIEMVIFGMLVILGAAARTTGLATTLGLASVPVVAAVQGQPGSLVALGGAIVAVILIRRLEGVGDVVKEGVSPVRAVLYRCVFDSSGPPSAGRLSRSRQDFPPPS